jgi:capsule polysaccharide export protein KpsC/LpsZ
MIDNDFTYPPTLEELKQILIQRKLKAKQESIPEKSQVELAKQYALAELTHATQGPASEADAAARLAICMACPDRAVEYKGMTDAGGVGWCTKCGCGNNPRAMLTVKVTLAGVECPLAKWGKVEGTGASVASAVDAVAGVAKSIIHKLSGG